MTVSGTVYPPVIPLGTEMSLVPSLLQRTPSMELYTVLSGSTTISSSSYPVVKDVGSIDVTLDGMVMLRTVVLSCRMNMLRDAVPSGTV